MEQRRITEMVTEVPGNAALIREAFNRQERRKTEAQAKRCRRAVRGATEHSGRAAPIA